MTRKVSLRERLEARARQAHDRAAYIQALPRPSGDGRAMPPTSEDEDAEAVAPIPTEEAP